MKINWITPNRSRSSSVSGVLATLGPAREGDEVLGTSVTLYPDLMRAMNIRIGDRVMIGDAGKHVALRRVETGGFAIYPTGKSGNARESLIGTYSTGTVRVRVPLAADKVSYKAADIIISDETLLLKKPTRKTRAEAPSHLDIRPNTNALNGALQGA